MKKKFKKKLLTKETICCTECSRNALIRTETISAQQAKGLIWIETKAKKKNDYWVDVKNLSPPEWMLRNNDYQKLRYWNLIERKINIDTSKNHSGIYRLTRRGLLFIKGQIEISRCAYVFDDTVYEYSDGTTNIYNCLKKNWDFQDYWKEQKLPFDKEGEFVI